MEAANDRVQLIYHCREQGTTCLCGQLLGSEHVPCNAVFGKKGIDVQRCTYNESLSYKVKQNCTSCMEEMYDDDCRLTKDYKCLLCDKQRKSTEAKIDCECYCIECFRGNYTCTCCRICNKEIKYCLLHNHCCTLE